MVANITTGSNLYGALFYNQEKVDKGVGTVIYISLNPDPKDNLRTNNYPKSPGIIWIAWVGASVSYKKNLQKNFSSPVDLKCLQIPDYDVFV